MGLKESKLSDYNIEKLSKRTNFSTDDIKRWYVCFMNDAPTGEMQKSEFINVYRELFPNGDATKFSSYIFNVIDFDGSGSISFEEFIEGLKLTSHGPIDEKLDWAFSLFDLDKSGAISREEATNVFESIFSLVKNSDFFKEEVGKMSVDERVDRVFELMDTDGNGELDKQEFIEGAHQDQLIIDTLSLYNMFYTRSNDENSQ